MNDSRIIEDRERKKQREKASLTKYSAFYKCKGDQRFVFTTEFVISGVGKVKFPATEFPVPLSQIPFPSSTIAVTLLQDS